MGAKRKRVVLSLKDKVEIINKLKKGVAGKVLADRCGVGAATITDIKNNSEKFLSFVTALETGDSLRMLFLGVFQKRCTRDEPEQFFML